MTVHTTFDSPLGELLLVGEASATAPGGTALASLSVPGQKGGATVQDGWVRDDEAFTAITGQLRAYFAGTLTHFDIEYADGAGTEFQRKVWSALDSVPYGTTTASGSLSRTFAASRGEPTPARTASSW